MQGEGPEEIATAATATAAATAGELKKGPWTAAEDEILTEYVRRRGEGNWNAVRRNTQLLRCGKSCRLRWMNHLRPDLKKGSFSPHEEISIARLHAQFGNKWALMATQLPGRTDNEIKNYWNTRVKRHRRAGLPLYPPDVQSLFFSSTPPSPTAPPQPPGRQRLAFVPPSPLVVEPPLFAFSTSAPASPILTNCSSSMPLFVPPLSQFPFPLSTPVSPSTPSAPLLPSPRMFLLGDDDELPSNQSSVVQLPGELPSNQLLVPGGALSATAASSAEANMVDAMVEELREDGELLVAESYILPYQQQVSGAVDDSAIAVINMKSEANQILNMIPASSPVATDEELELALQFQQCPLITDDNWNITGPCPWNNMPRIC